MARTNVRRADRGPGADVVNEGRAVDDALNERLNSETARKKLDPRMANNRNRVKHKPQTSGKRSGRLKH